MKVLGVLGSPRRGGNTEILLDQALSGAESQGCAVKKIILNEIIFKPCQGCQACAATGKCVIDDEMQAVYQQVDEADAIIIASPIFFGSLSAQIKAMVDRYQCRWQAKYVLGKKIDQGVKKGFLLLVSAANREKFFQNAESIIKNLFAVLDIDFTGKVYCPNVDQKAKILKHPNCLKQAFELGRRIEQ